MSLTLKDKDKWWSYGIEGSFTVLDAEDATEANSVRPGHLVGVYDAEMTLVAVCTTLEKAEIIQKALDFYEDAILALPDDRGGS